MGMERNVFLILGFAILIFVAGEDPRVLAAAVTNKESPSPTPSASPPAKHESKSTLDSNSKSNDTKPKSNSNPTAAYKLNSTNLKGPSTSNDSTRPTLNGPKKGNDDKADSKNLATPPNATDSNTSPKKEEEGGVCKVLCKDEENLTACLRDPGPASNKLILLVENVGEVTLKVNINISASAKTENQELQLPKHSHKQINVSVHAGETSKIFLSAGHGNCTLQLQQTPLSAGAPTSPLDFFRLPSYTTYMTPVYGAYLFFLSVLIIGGTWACCKFGRRSRRDGGGVSYQELEMGLPESSSAVGVDTADGWDQGWDDDWEEDKAVSRTQERAGNVSVNGLTSRSGNKEGWDDGWDD